MATKCRMKPNYNDWRNLYHKCREGNEEEVKIILESKEFSKADSDGNCHSDPLYAASINGNVNIVRCLFEHGLEFNGRGNSPLVAAAMYNHVDVVRALVEEYGYDVSDQHALYRAVGSGSFEVVNYLVGAGADVNGHCGGNYKGLLFPAVRKNNILLVKYLVEAGTDVNYHEFENNETVLFPAVENKNIELVKYLVKAGVNVNVANVNMTTTLFLAAKGGDIDLVKYLVESGADVKFVKRNDETVLFPAVERGDLQLVKYLVEAGAEVNNEGVNGTVLHLCVKSGNQEMCEYILSQKFDQIDAWNYLYETALFAAVLAGSESICKTLVTHGADVNIGTDRESSFMYAIQKCDLETIMRFYKFGADPDITDSYRQRPIEVAVEENRLSVVCYMAVSLNVPLIRSTGQQYSTNFMTCLLRECKRLHKMNIDTYLRSNQLSTVTVLLKAGCYIRPKDNDTLTTLVKSLPPGEDSTYITTVFPQPRSLKELSCFCIRRVLGTKLPRVVDSLPLPKTLIDFIKLTHINIKQVVYDAHDYKDYEDDSDRGGDYHGYDCSF